MKWYLAARYVRHSEVAQRARDLRRREQKVSSTWHDQPFDASDNGVTMEQDAVYLQEEAWRDYAEVTRADGLILFSDEPEVKVRGGKFVEFGIALALKKRLVVIGRREVLFHHLGIVEVYDTWEDFLAQIEKEEHAKAVLPRAEYDYC